MDPDIPQPSIEYDELPDVLPDAPSTKTQTQTKKVLDRMSLGTATSTPLPPSSPVKSPRKTPKLQRQTSSLGSPASETPSYHSTRSGPSNNEWRSTTPNLNMKRSNSNLAANSGRELTPSRQSGSRRVSSNQIKTMSPLAYIKSQELEKKPATAGSVAREYFAKELAHTQKNSPQSQTVIFVHDSCYGHRFSRPRTSRAALGTIVERPERMLAILLGVSTAYVRLGGRHAEAGYGPSPTQDPANISRPPFTIRKTSRFVPLNHPAVIHVHGAKWMEELQIMCDSAEGKLALNGKELVRPIGYGKDENGAPLPKLHEGDLYLCAESLNALQGCLGGVCDAVDSVFSSDSTTRAFVAIRPPGHHCSSNFPSGFCWLNNVHVGIAHAAMNHGLTHAAIIDFDLHHGDGSQTITWDHNRKAQTLQKNAAAHKKTPIGYFSLHDINSYPCEMGDEDKVRNASLCIENAHGQSIWNVHLEPWKSLEEFWKLYETRYLALLEKTKVFLRYHTNRLNASHSGPRAKAAIFLSAGFDASEWEGAGMQRHKVNVPTDFYAKFTADVVRLSEEEGLGVDGRVISVLEGGYSDRALTSGALSHICGLSQRPSQVSTNVNGNFNNAQSGCLNVEYELNGSMRDDENQFYDPTWWASRNLELLESKVNPEMPLPTKKPKEKQPGDYSAPTEASTAKMTDTARERRSLSSQFSQRMVLEPEPVQPPPEVDWATSSFELSRLLIPSDRQTLSCRHEDLNAEATRARKERQSMMVLPVSEEPRELRARKAKPVPFEAVPIQERSKSREARRRTTMASVADLPDPQMNYEPDDGLQSTDRPRRRSSAASSMMSAFEGLKMSDRQSVQPSHTGSDPSDSRASSVMAAKIPKAPVVRKTRTVGNAKVPAKPRASPKKPASTAPPLPRVPSSFTKTPNGDVSGTEVTTDEQRSSQVHSNAGGSVVKADDVDTLTGGMNKLKIKLKVPSPEENAEREKKAAEKSQPKPKAIRKPPVPKAAKVPKVKTERAIKSSTEQLQKLKARQEIIHSTHVPVTHVVPSEPNPWAEETGARITPASSRQIERVTTVGNGVPEATGCHSLEPFDVVEEGSHSGDATFTVLVDSPQASNLANLPISSTSSPTPFPPEGSASSSKPAIDENTPSSVHSTGPFASSIAPTAATAIKRTKADLPTFTSSSPIPFSKNSSLVDKDDVSLERPRTADATKVIEIKSETTPSIWDIPETPKPQQQHQQRQI